MVELIVDNSYSQVKGLKSGEMAKLRKILSYRSDPQAAYHSGGYIRTYYLVDKQGLFPTGLLVKVTNFLLENKISCTRTDLRKEPVSKFGRFKLNLKDKPYNWQYGAAMAAQMSSRGGIVATTGSGKSLVIALIASRLNVQTLVIVPTLEIKKQLQKSLYDVLGDLTSITVKNIDASDLDQHTHYDCLIIDECHHAAAKTYQKLNKKTWKGIYYRFFLTATFFRNKRNEQLLFEGICGEEIYRLTYQEAVKQGIIVPVEAYYYELPKIPVEGYRWAEVYKELVVNREDRNELIAQIMTNLNSAHKSTLCLVKEIAHGHELSRISGIPFANGGDEESRNYIGQFNSGKLTCLIGTTGILSEGVDTKPCEYVIICGLGKAKSAFMQAIGRSVRRHNDKESGKVILFRDSSHKFAVRHFSAQKKILLDEYCVRAIKL